MYLITKHLVKSFDIGVNNNLYGGRMLDWLDEAAALYLLECMPHCKFVTFKLTETIFHNPVHAGEVISFYVAQQSVGLTSVTLSLVVKRGETTILSTSMVFVNVGADGHSAKIALPEDIRHE